MLRSCGVSINPNFVQVEGRGVLPAPKCCLISEIGSTCQNSAMDCCKLCFSARCDLRGLVRDLIKCGDMKGIAIDAPFDVYEEKSQFRLAPPMVRVEKKFEAVQSTLPGQPQFILCLLLERENSDLYGPWKRKCLAEYGIVSQWPVPHKFTSEDQC